ncbi:MAG: hypothetical protein MUF87_21545 [Anaerolineae bacterium]|jgi:hypothetical protein|nr:hypothetical protein [Anaerolineae bacterium]
MNTIRELHQQAMAMADQAFINRHHGLHDQAIKQFQEAYRLEFKAAQQTTKEPGRSILHRSAATLALHGQLFPEAEKAAVLGLSGNPPPDIADELRDVFEKANFYRHLSLQGLELNPNEVQMSIVGNAIAQGMAQIDDVLIRVQSLEKLIVRTAQRIHKKPYGKMPTHNQGFNLFMSPPRSGSFAVTLRVGHTRQEMFPEMDDRQRIIDEVIFNLSLLNENKIEALRSAIPEKAYFESFLGFAKNMAPDGDHVRMVGVTALRKGEEVSVGLSVINKNIKLVMEEDIETSNTDEAKETVQIIGYLMVGNAIKNKIQVVDGSNKKHTIEVSEAIAEDVVRPYFGRSVIIDAVRVNGKKLMFRDINPDET